MIPVPKDAIDEIGRLAAEVSRLRERIAELEEALRPFARVCDIIPVDDGDAAVQTVVYGTISLSAGQFRAARAALLGDAPKSPEEIESSVRQMLADPAIKRDVREFAKTISPTAEDLSRRIGAAPKEERCHVWGRDVSRWKLPEFAPTGNAGDPGAR